MWELVRSIHLLAMAFFVGGQLVLAAVVVPVLRHGDRAPLRAAARRFAAGTLIVLALLIATGVAMASHHGDWGRTALHAKLGLVVVVGILIGWHARRPERHALEAAVFLLSLVIVWLGVALSHSTIG
jgi:putative copper export protein